MGEHYQLLFYLTAVVLVAGMVALELYRLRAGKRGRLRRFLAADSLGLGEAVVEVQMEDGAVVEAKLPACTQCVCRFRPGDAVVLTLVRGRYYVGAAVR